MTSPDLMMAFLLNSPIMERVVTVLQEPDSPTIANVSPLCKSKLTPRIACTSPAKVLKLICKFLTLNIGSFMFVTYSFILGSKASRSPSANKLKDNIKTEIIAAGYHIKCGKKRKVLYPSLIKVPNDASGAGIPIPIKLKNASKKIALG